MTRMLLNELGSERMENRASKSTFFFKKRVDQRIKITKIEQCALAKAQPPPLNSIKLQQIANTEISPLNKRNPDPLIKTHECFNEISDKVKKQEV